MLRVQSSKLALYNIINKGIKLEGEVSLSEGEVSLSKRGSVFIKSLYVWLQLHKKSVIAIIKCNQDTEKGLN